MKENTLLETLKSLFASLVIIIALAVSIIIYLFVFGDGSHFEGGDNNNHALQGDYLGIIYKGGFIVPILMMINIVVIVFTIERIITIAKAKGRGRIESFIRNIRSLINNGQVDAAIEECDRQRGSLANVVRAGLTRYKMVQNDNTLDNEKKQAALQKELEEATALELPMLSKNLVILSTTASISVLVGLIGTVIGMIRAFGAMATTGAPDTVALSQGISEALVNTALGIIGSTVSIVMYNYFSNKIDSLTYGIDEANFSILQTFASKK
jgi:biopolymer transport protein ExbB